jgi:hypothetical protein
MADQVVVSFSEIDAFRQCPFKHHLAYRQRWQTDVESIPLQRGTAWHKILETRYEGQRTGTEAAALDKINRLLTTDDGTTEEQELLEWMYDGYCDMFDEEDREWTVRAAEFKGFAPLNDRFMLKVKIDLVAVLRGRLWVWDHKSGKNLPYDKELDLDDQMGLYIWCMRQMGYPVAGAIYNSARTQRNKGEMALDERFRRVPLRRTDYELNIIAQEAIATCNKMWPEQFDGIPERNPNTDTCRWRCGFTEACLSNRKGGRIKDMLEAHGYESRPFREVEIEYAEYLEAQNG